MDPDKWERVKAVYYLALDQDSGTRAAFLDGACGDDREIRREVESLLAQAGDDSFLERPAWEADASGAGNSGPGEAAAWHTPGAASEAEGLAGRLGPLVWVVYLAAAGVIAGTGYAAWMLPQEMPAFGWLEARRGGLCRVSAVNAAPVADKLQPGDMLLSLNGDTNVARGGTRPYRQSAWRGVRSGCSSVAPVRATGWHGWRSPRLL